MNQVTSVAMVTDHHIESGIGYYGLELARCMQPYAATLLYKPFQPNKQDAALHQSLPWLRKIPYRSFKELRPYIFPAFTHFALQNSDASLYHAHWFMAGLGAMTLRKKPVLVTMHDVSLLHIPEFSLQFIRFYRWALQQFKKAQLPILVVSHQAKSDAIHYAHYPEALVHVVYNGINHERFQPQPHASGPTARFRFVYAGGLGQRKNVGLLLEAFRQVSRQYPEAELHIAGGFPEHTPYPTMAQALNLKNVVFRGFIADEAMAEFYTSGHCMVYTSQYEGFGMAPLEAMACGVPVITTTGGALKEVSGGGACVLASYQTEDLAHAMARMIESTELQQHFREKGLAWAQQFTWEKTAVATREAYEVALRGKRLTHKLFKPSQTLV